MTTPPTLPGQQPPLGPPAGGPAPLPRQPFPPPGPIPPPAGYAVPLQGYQYQPGPAPGYGYPPAGPPMSPGGQRLAEFGDRLLARIIDQAIVGGISAVVFIPVYLIVVFTVFSNIPTTVTTRDDPFRSSTTPTVNPFEFLLPLLGVFAVLMLLALVFAYLYEVEMTFRTGQTIGKRIMKIQVIPVDPALTLTRGLAAKRFLVMQGCGLVPALGWVDGLWQLWDKPYQQCLHDKYAATLVIKLNP